MENYPTKVDGVSTEPAAEYNDITTELKNTVENTGQTLTSLTDDQLGTGISIYAGAGDFYTDSGSVNAHTLTTNGDLKGPIAYLAGLRARFIALTTNTSSVVTVNVNSIGIKPITKAEGEALSPGDISAGDIIELHYDLSDYFVLDNISSRSRSQLTPLHIDGLVIENVAPATYDGVKIHPGICTDSTSTVDIKVDSILGKRLDAAWVAGDGNGGLATGSMAADTWYHIFLIKNIDGTVDGGFDTDVNATNLLATSTYTYYRRVGSVLTDSTPEIHNFHMRYSGTDRYFVWDVPDNHYKSITEGASTSAIIDIDVPTDVTCGAVMRCSLEYDGLPIEFANLYLSADYMTNITASINNYQLSAGGTNSDNTVLTVLVKDQKLRYNLSLTSPSNTQIELMPRGWFDDIGYNQGV